MRPAVIIIIVGLLLGPMANSRAAASNAPLNEDLLTFIRALEAPDGYNDYERRIRIAPPQPLTKMTVGEVLAWQQQSRRLKTASTAAGGYQIIYPTLSRLVRTYNIDRNRTFDARLQDELARHLLAECGARPTTRNTKAHPRYGNCLASIWASLPRTAGKRRGYSAHHGIAGNKALTTPEVVLAVLAGEQTLPIVPNGSRRASGSRHRPPKPKQLAFGAVRIADANAAMRKTNNKADLTPSVHKWAFDPYASE
ncbi:MAG: hypothetical protein OXC63_08260 [Aestuariivita sp.]|nr:hypothetical protein [Aestuariivita sp.]MCY4345384.1 hypothetical protein [Aestuariivita sp.]